MKRYLSLISLVLSIIYLSTVHAYDYSSDVSENSLYRVVWVIDGDTIKLDNGQHVRLIGIDAPENRDDAKLRKDLRRRHLTKAQELNMGRQAHNYLKKLIEGKKVRLKFDVSKYDQYHRILAYVYLTDGTFVNAKILKDGYAYPVNFKPDIKYAEVFQKLYKQAREDQKGLWQNGGYHEKRIKWFHSN